MKVANPYLRLNRLRVVRRGHVVYDQLFHEGVNIIRGQNGSGKSTLSDFIFYVLGGDYEDWKDAASQCDEVQAEISTPRGTLSLRRTIGARTTPISVFFGSMKDAAIHSLEGWENFPIKRSQNRESFSQVAFRSIGIPEAKSDGASNITMHQLLRLCYSDQRTPASRLFRFEQFDTQVIREAVGDLVCGLSDYELYEIGLQIRSLDKELDVAQTRLHGLLKALPPDDAYRSTEAIQSVFLDLSAEKRRLLDEISRIDDLLKGEEVAGHLKDRKNAQKAVSGAGQEIEAIESRVATLNFEIREISEFQKHLEEMLERLGYAEKASHAIGAISFTHCPACGVELSEETAEGHCAVCQAPSDTEKEKSHYNRIRLDLEIQARESKQLMSAKLAELESGSQNLRALRRRYEEALGDFEIRYSGANGPREAFLAVRTSRIGHIEAELTFLVRSLEIANEIELLRDAVAKRQGELNELRDREESLQKRAATRRRQAFSRISDIGASILRSDLEDRQEEFGRAQTLELGFRNDSISVDGKVNFAESSNVFLKNTAVLSMFLAAGVDDAFFHPRFLLLDNIEDKGMEPERSHLFQRIIVERATALQVPYQVIFTTSMMNPELDLEEYTIGPQYTKGQRTLELS